MRLSLVVPVYNVAEYLPACLESIAQQSRQPDEIIAVDDGSTDRCPEILLDHQARLPQMRIVRRDNGGLSAARNTGLEYATGDWLAFLDSDDRLDPEHCRRAVSMAETHDLDMALFNGWFDFEGRMPESLIYPDEPTSEVMSGKELLAARLARKSFLHMVWLHLYRRQFIEDLGLRFVPPWIHEDVPWTTRALLAAKRVQYDEVPLVHYRKPQRRPAPGTARDARWRLAAESSAFNARELDRIVVGVEDPQLASLLGQQMVDGAMSIFHKLEKVDSTTERREVRRKLRAEGVFALLWRHAKETRFRRRIAKNWIKSFF